MSYPNPQDALPLPPRPDLDHYRRRAKDLAKACRTGDDTAIETWVRRWLTNLSELQAGRRKQEARVERRVEQITAFARERMRPDCALSQAQFVIARAHGFASWPKLVDHLHDLARKSPVSAFEEAADAIVSGDLTRLRRLVSADPALVHARSTREHNATLLHYVAANGVENYRQLSPPNIVAIARQLLDAGAEVDAEADVYGGGATTFGLVVTSTPPRVAGVQIELADLLLDRGARLDPGSVHACLMNGCPEAAAHLVTRGAALNLAEAAGVGRVDLVRRQFEGGHASAKDATAALLMAAWYGRADVTGYLLDHGVDVGSRAEKDGDTALHIAAYLGHTSLVELLLGRGAPVNVRDDRYGTPPLVWALHAWLVEKRKPDDAYRAILRMLAGAGAEVKPEWLDDDRLRADPELFSVLRAAGQNATHAGLRSQSTER